MMIPMRERSDRPGGPGRGQLSAIQEVENEEWSSPEVEAPAGGVHGHRHYSNNLDGAAALPSRQCQPPAMQQHPTAPRRVTQQHPLQPPMQQPPVQQPLVQQQQQQQKMKKKKRRQQQQARQQQSSAVIPASRRDETNLNNDIELASLSGAGSGRVRAPGLSRIRRKAPSNNGNGSGNGDSVGGGGMGATSASGTEEPRAILPATAGASLAMHQAHFELQRHRAHIDITVEIPADAVAGDKIRVQVPLRSLFGLNASIVPGQSEPDPEPMSVARDGALVVQEDALAAGGGSGGGARIAFFGG